MIKVENIEPWGFKHAIRGMRNPMNSWDKSDSESCYNQWPDWPDCTSCMWYKDDQCRKPWLTDLKVGQSDLGLMQKLYKAGPEHRKYLRQIFVSMDITAPLYWWKEFDTYKVGTVANSCSTMHKIAAKQFALEDFSVEHLYSDELEFFKEIVDRLNSERELYLENDIPSRKKCDWWQMIQLLPSGHKLDEWNEFVKVLEDLPYIKEITEYEC